MAYLKFQTKLKTVEHIHFISLFVRIYKLSFFSRLHTISIAQKIEKVYNAICKDKDDVYLLQYVKRGRVAFGLFYN